MNRLDKVVVFHPLREEQLEEILDIELGIVQQRVLDTGRGQFLFRVTAPARRFLLQEGTDLKYGARHLKRAIEKFVVNPLANLVATEQIRFGDMLVVDWDGKTTQLSFHKEGEGAMVPVSARSARGAAAQQAVKATGGRAVEAPAAVIVREAKAAATLSSGAPMASSQRKIDTP
jgi:ATP-dependent Clp protease ATP-binding subunit ClpB